MIYLWLKDDPETTEAAWYQRLVPREKYGLGIRKDDLTGKSFIQLHEDPLDPTAKLPPVPQEGIASITCRIRIDRGLRTEGMYNLKSATIYVKTIVENRTRGYEDEETLYQEVNASAASFDDLRQALVDLRSGVLLPRLDFERPQPRVIELSFTMPYGERSH